MVVLPIPGGPDNKTVFKFDPSAGPLFPKPLTAVPALKLYLIMLDFQFLSQVVSLLAGDMAPDWPIILDTSEGLYLSTSIMVSVGLVDFGVSSCVFKVRSEILS